MQTLESDREWGLRRSFKASPNEGERLRWKEKSVVTNGIEAIGDQYTRDAPRNARFASIA